MKTIRISGLLYIIIILLGTFKVNLIEPNSISFGQNGSTSIDYNEWLFRLGIGFDVLMYLLVLVLSLLFYRVLKPLNGPLAFSALIFRTGEALLGCTVTILSGILPLILLNRSATSQPDQLQTLIESLITLREWGLYVVLIFIGIGGTLFLYLFYTARLIPRILAAWGVFTYASMFILGFIALIGPNPPEAIEMGLFALGALFELLFGLWLLFKGIDVKNWKNHAQQLRT